MPIEPRYLPLVGGLALLPVLAYNLVRPELGSILSIPSTILIIASVMWMLWPERKKRGKIFGAP